MYKVEIDKDNFKKEMILMHRRGYDEGLKDFKESMISTLKNFQIIQKRQVIPIDDVIDFIKKINVKKYMH